MTTIKETLNKEDFWVIIAGSRTFNDYETLKEFCNEVLSEKIKTHDICILSGTARGADKLGEKYAEEMGFSVNRFPAEWDLYGKSAGFIRNKEMVHYADAGIFFWDGTSKGTKHCINLCKEKGIPIRIKKP